MKIRELFEEWSYSFYDKLYEMAFSRREIESKITNVSYEIIEHLIKVLKWEDALNYQKHLSDINGWLRKLNCYRFNRDKRPKERDYFQWMCVDVINNEKILNTWISDLTNYHQLKSIRSNEDVYNKLIDIFSKMSFDLAHDKFYDIRDYIK